MERLTNLAYNIRTNRGDLLSGGERRRTEIARCLATDQISCSTSRLLVSTLLLLKTYNEL
jgi:ABC-type hemin transport system ATPase subunit